MSVLLVIGNLNKEMRMIKYSQFSFVRHRTLRLDAGIYFCGKRLSDSLNNYYTDCQQFYPLSIAPVNDVFFDNGIGLIRSSLLRR